MGGERRHRWLVEARFGDVPQEKSDRRRQWKAKGHVSTSETRGGCFSNAAQAENKDPDFEPSGTICTPEGETGLAVPPAFTTQLTKLEELTCYFQTVARLLIRAMISRPGVYQRDSADPDVCEQQLL